MASDTFRFLGLDSLSCEATVLDKDHSIKQYVGYMLDRTNQMFKYDSLPESIPEYMLEQFLQTSGVVCVCHAKFIQSYDALPSGDIYAFTGSFMNVPDPYYRPTGFIVTNPTLSQSLNLTIGKDCAIIQNDTRCIGLLPLFFRYAEQMAENDVSIRSAQINSRQRTLISASTDRERESAEAFVEDLIAGKLSVVAETPFLEGVRVQNMGTTAANNIIQLIELQQYLKASWFNELGLNSNFNMKREYLSAEEIAASTDVLLPLVDDMLTNRQRGIEMVNKMFGTSISVHKNSAWENKQRESQAGIESKEAEANAPSKPRQDST